MSNNNQKMHPSQQTLKEIFVYDVNGFLCWKKSGKRAGTKSDNQYSTIGLGGKTYYAHRLIYIFFNGSIAKGLQCDHINGIKSDNQIKNLRVVSHQMNSFNRHSAKGFYYNKIQRMYMAYIRINNLLINLGYYTTAELARLAYLKGKEKYHVIHEF